MTIVRWNAWVPPVDIYQNGDHELVLKAELPEMAREDIDITVENYVLTIKGEKRHEKEEKDERYHRMERSYGAFARSVRLPVAVDGSKVNATFKNGLLTVTLPKTAGAKGTAIPVKAE